MSPEEKAGLLAELVRRRVIKVLAIYGGAAWAMTELVTAMAEAWGLPPPVTRYALLAFIGGFPLVAVLSWLYDIRDRRVHRVAGSDWQFALFATVVVALTVLGLWLVLRAAPDMSAPTAEEPWQAALDDGVTSVAVLPFVNRSDDPSNEYFSDGISDELIDTLALIPNLRVPSRTSSFAFKGVNLGIREIAGKLRADLILEGSVRRTGNRVRIRTQLIDVAKDSRLWSETYDRELTDIFAIQTDIANQIASRLSTSLDGALPALGGQTSDLDAYDLYLQGKHLLRSRDADSINEAVDLLTQSVETDPEFAAGHATLASAFLLKSIGMDTGWEDDWRMSRSAAEEALRLNPKNPVALSTLGKIYEYELEWAKSRAMYEQAILRQPNDATTRHWYANHLRRVGKLEEGLREILLAADLDPQNAGIVGLLVMAYYENGEIDRALTLMSEKVEEGLLHMTGALWIFDMLVKFEQERLDQVRQSYRDIIAARGLPVDAFEPVLQSIGADGATPEAKAVMEAMASMPGVDVMNVAQMYTLVGEPGLAIVTMHAADARNVTGLSTFLWFPAYRQVRKHADFEGYVKSIGLLDYWWEFGVPDLCRMTDGSLACE